MLLPQFGSLALIDSVESTMIATLYGSGMAPLVAAVDVALRFRLVLPKSAAKKVGIVAVWVTETAFGSDDEQGARFLTLVMHSGVTVVLLMLKPE
jgi:hypothetical protein